jgi:hypothetical protein
MTMMVVVIGLSYRVSQVRREEITLINEIRSYAPLPLMIHPITTGLPTIQTTISLRICGRGAHKQKGNAYCTNSWLCSTKRLGDDKDGGQHFILCGLVVIIIRAHSLRQ